MSTILWATLFFVIGFALGIRAHIAVDNEQVKRGKMFFCRRGQWYGDADAIRRDIEAKR